MTSLNITLFVRYCYFSLSRKRERKRAITLPYKSFLFHVIKKLSKKSQKSVKDNLLICRLFNLKKLSLCVTYCTTMLLSFLFFSLSQRKIWHTKGKQKGNSYPCFAHLHSTTSGHSVSRLYVHITRASDLEPFIRQIRILPGTVCHNYMYI